MKDFFKSLGVLGAIILSAGLVVWGGFEIDKRIQANDKRIKANYALQQMALPKDDFIHTCMKTYMKIKQPYRMSHRTIGAACYAIYDETHTSP